MAVCKCRWFQRKSLNMSDILHNTFAVVTWPSWLRWHRKNSRNSGEKWLVLFMIHFCVGFHTQVAWNLLGTQEANSGHQLATEERPVGRRRKTARAGVQVCWPFMAGYIKTVSSIVSIWPNILICPSTAGCLWLVRTMRLSEPSCSWRMRSLSSDSSRERRTRRISDRTFKKTTLNVALQNSGSFSHTSVTRLSDFT